MMPLLRNLNDSSSDNSRPAQAVALRKQWPYASSGRVQTPAAGVLQPRCNESAASLQRRCSGTATVLQRRCNRSHSGYGETRTERNRLWIEHSV